MSFSYPCKTAVCLCTVSSKKKKKSIPPLQAVNEGYFPCCSSQDNPLCNVPAPALLWRGKSLIGGILLCSGEENLLTGLSPWRSWLWRAVQEEFFFFFFFAMALLRMSQLLHKAASHFPPEESQSRGRRRGGRLSLCLSAGVQNNQMYAAL